MREENEKADDELVWGVALFFLALRSVLENEIKYEEFSVELCSVNRFTTSTKKEVFINEFNEVMKEYIYSLNEQSVFYRARLLDVEFLSQKGYSNTLSNFSFLSVLDVIVKNLSLEIVADEKELFTGYSATESVAPPSHKTREGRLNPKNISYLYVAEDMETAVQELRPQVKQKVSVATIKTLRPMNILDLTKIVSNETITLNDQIQYQPKTFYEVISEVFRLPNYGDPQEYLPTQYLAEYIRSVMGLDGVRY